MHLQYSSQIVKTDTASLEFFRKFLGMGPLVRDLSEISRGEGAGNRERVTTF